MDDQDSTDLEKCVDWLSYQKTDTQVNLIIAYGAFGGRVDHNLHCMHTLQKYYQRNQCADVFALMGEESLMMYLKAGLTEIKQSKYEDSDGCGLIPIGKPVEKISTTGLKWNLGNFERQEGESIQFGKLISTSNAIVAPTVKVMTSDPVFWTTTLKEQKDLSKL